MSDVPRFDPDAGEPGYLWEAVAAHITARIEAGELPPGGRLPGERDLARVAHSRGADGRDDHERDADPLRPADAEHRARAQSSRRPQGRAPAAKCLHAHVGWPWWARRAQPTA